MFDLEKWQEILNSLKQHKLRTLLTAFGVFWGILMLILLLGGGTGLRNGVEDMFRSDVRSSITFSGRKTTKAYKGQAQNRRIELTVADVKAIKQQVSGLHYIASEKRLSGSLAITRGQQSASYATLGVSGDYFNIKAFQDYRRGRRLNALDNIESRKVIVLGTRVVEALFDVDENPIGQYVKLNNIPFKVVGVFYDSDRHGRMSEYLYLPMTTLQKIFGYNGKIDRIIVTPNTRVDGEQLEREVLRLLQERHRIAPDDRLAIRARSAARDATKMISLFFAIDALIWFVGIGTLTAGVVGVSNIMIITVKERTREIGIRKALGATPGSIISLVLMESIVVTAVAGYAGLLLGVGLLEGVKYFLEAFNIELLFFARPEVDFNVVITALLLLITTGTLAGLIPALQAAKITPVEAMRDD